MPVRTRLFSARDFPHLNGKASRACSCDLTHCTSSTVTCCLPTLRLAPVRSRGPLVLLIRVRHEGCDPSAPISSPCAPPSDHAPPPIRRGPPAAGCSAGRRTPQFTEFYTQLPWRSTPCDPATGVAPASAVLTLLGTWDNNAPDVTYSIWRPPKRQVTGAAEALQRLENRG